MPRSREGDTNVHGQPENKDGPERRRLARRLAGPNPRNREVRESVTNQTGFARVLSSKACSVLAIMTPRS